MTEAALIALDLPLRTPFRIAHGSYSFRRNLFLALRQGGVRGFGEAPIVPYYGLSPEEVEADLRLGLGRLTEGALLGGDLPEGREFAHPVSRSAVQGAVLSLRSALSGASPAALLGLPEPTRPFPSSYTIAYDDDPEAMVALARDCGFRRLKVKAGIPGDIERLTYLRRALPGALFRVDANQGWSLEEAPAKLRALESLGVDLVEEPVAGSPADFEALARATSLPLLLDESLRSAGDLEAFVAEAPSVAGIVVKTAKNGGPAASLALARKARDLGLKVMLSCMVETSLGVAAALPLAGLAHWVDLDAPLLIAEDPFHGFGYEGEGPAVAPGGLVPGPAFEAALARAIWFPVGA